MTNKFSILNGANYFSSGIFRNYLVFILATKHIKYFGGTTEINFWKSNGMSGQKKLLKIQLNQTEILHQPLLIIMY